MNYDVKLLAKCVAFGMAVVICVGGVVLRGQVPAYDHDVALDAINNNIATLDSDLNAKQFGVTASNLEISNVLNEYQYTNDMNWQWTNFANKGIMNITASGIAGGSTNLFWNSNNVIAAQGMAAGVTNSLWPLMSVGSGVVSNYYGNLPNGNGAFNTNAGGLFGGVLPSEIGDNSHEYVGFNLGSSGVTWYIDLNIRSLDASGFLSYFLPFWHYFVLGVWGLILLQWCIHDVDVELDRLFSQRQTVGTTEEVLGVNASILAAFAYNWVFLAVVGVVVSAVLAFGVWGFGSLAVSYVWSDSSYFDDWYYFWLSGASGDSGGYVTLAVLQDVLELVPAISMLQEYMIYLMFSLVGMKVAFYIARLTIRFLPA